MEVRLLIFGLLFLGINRTMGSSDVKSSLTLVIDITVSMTDDINQVKQGANAIFETVKNSNSSQIENYVLVVFHTSYAKTRIVTKDTDVFKGFLDEVAIDTDTDDWDCPERAMSGIELGLKESLEGSAIYVFTDSSAKDYKKCDEVTALSQKMGSQVVFVLTGVCENRIDEDYLVYPKLARATNGQVFHLERNEIGKVLKYVENNIESRKNILKSKTYPAGYGNTFDVNVDGDTKELVISLSGESPSVDVTDSAGTKCSTIDITRLKEIAIVKVVGVKPGVYKVEVGSKSETHVVVSGSTSVHFQHGFSVISPSAITDTVKQPVPGEKSHLAIKLAADGNVTLLGVQILDMDDNVILEEPLKIVNETDQFYTTESIIPPNHMFRIAIKGYDASTNTYLTRISLTPVQPQYVPVIITQRSPVVTIDGSPKINAKYDDPLQVKCKVSGYPKPSVIWESDDKFDILSYTVSPVELPYDYVSVLNISNVRKNATYCCKAVNSEGDGDSSVTVETIRPRFFDIVSLPKDLKVEYKKQVEISCKVDAFPPANVSWYKGRSLLSPDGNLELSPDSSVLTIRSMEPYIADEYICEVRNSDTRRFAPFKVDITGVEPPEISKSTYDIYTIKGTKTDVQCQINKGHPKPVIYWSYRKAGETEFGPLDESGDTLHFEEVEAADAGAYKCVAVNIMGKDYHEIDLHVQYKPTISRRVSLRRTVNQGDMVVLTCPADGVPTPDVTWTHNGATLLWSTRYTFFRDGSIRFSATLSDTGVYECTAKNIHGEDSIKIVLDVTVPVDIELPKNSRIEQLVGLPVTLPCKADGSPKPEISWIFRKDAKSPPRRFRASDASGGLRFNSIQQRASGIYTCVATNSVNSKNITYEVSVLAPPSIRYTKKEFRAVVGDLQLRIPCEATGNPEPEISWSTKGHRIATGLKGFNIGTDGSLFIMNIDKLSEGSYVCTASNKFLRESKDFNVIVDHYPKPVISKSIFLEEGNSAIIPCSVPRRATDRLRWFKGPAIVSSSELILRNVNQLHSGTYTCRVSSVDKPARTASTKVEVGFRPRFTVNDEKKIKFEKEELAFMDCSATGQPEPQIKWYHNGKLIKFTDFMYVFVMTNANERGRYICEVSNRFGTVQQEFIISSPECLLDVNNDFKENEPLMLTPSETFTNFEISDGYLHIPNDKTIKLVCPSRFNVIPSREITVTCESDHQFIHQPSGERYAYSDLKCRSKLHPIVRRTGRQCKNRYSEMLNVGFEVKGRFKEVYQVCLDITTRNPIYTKLTMQQPLANTVANNDTEWFSNGSPVDLDNLYDCSYQNNEISANLNKEFHRYDGCCFARRMLVNPRDVAPGVPQAATYTHLNVAPHWGTCNSKNWEDVERRIRDLAISADRPLQVWTGTAQDLQLPDARSRERNVILSRLGKYIQVPKYLWKVVQDPFTNSSLAIIQVNVPDLKLIELHSYLLCTDVCHETTWMQSRDWHTVNHGYTYCCHLRDFERVFRYYGVFPRYDKLLKNVSFMPSSMI